MSWVMESEVEAYLPRELRDVVSWTEHLGFQEESTPERVIAECIQGIQGSLAGILGFTWSTTNPGPVFPVGKRVSALRQAKLGMVWELEELALVEQCPDALEILKGIIREDGLCKAYRTLISQELSDMGVPCGPEDSTLLDLARTTLGGHNPADAVTKAYSALEERFRPDKWTEDNPYPKGPEDTSHEEEELHELFLDVLDHELGVCWGPAHGFVGWDTGEVGNFFAWVNHETEKLTLHFTLNFHGEFPELFMRVTGWKADRVDLGRMKEIKEKIFSALGIEEGGDGPSGPDPRASTKPRSIPARPDLSDLEWWVVDLGNKVIYSLDKACEQGLWTGKHCGEKEGRRAIQMDRASLLACSMGLKIIE